MRLGTLFIILLLLLAVCLFLGKGVKDHFSRGESVSVTWPASSPAPQNIAYNWGVCISSGPGAPTPQGHCSTQIPPYPPGIPGAGWDYKGQTAVGQNSLTLNSLNCNQCTIGQVLTLQLQAIDMVNPNHPASNWAVFTLDMSSKSTVVANTITDATIPGQSLYPGSTGFIYTLQLNQPAFAAGNVANVNAQLIRGNQFYSYTSSAPFTSISTNNTTGTYTGSFTTVSPNASWTPSAPGPLQTGDVLTVFSEVFNPGTTQGNGQVFFAGSLSQTATITTPSIPSGVVWNISS